MQLNDIQVFKIGSDMESVKIYIDPRFNNLILFK